MVAGGVDMKKMFLFLFLIFIKLNGLEISLELKDAHNIKDEQTGTLNVSSDEIVSAIYLNERFKIIAIVDGAGRNSSEIEIKDLDKLHSSGLAQRQISFAGFNNNLSSSTRYTYGFIADQLGEFEIGPAVIQQGGQAFTSNKLVFKVIKKVSGQGVQDNKEYELFCRLEADKLNVVEGEPIELSLKIYRRGKVLQMGVHQVQFPGFEVKEIEDAVNGQEEVNGKIYLVLEKKYILIPLDTGPKKIEPIQVSFNVPEKRRVQGLGVFDDLSSLFGPMTKTLKSVSNGLQINVAPLPSYQKNVDGVGSFSKFEMIVDKNDAILNEPILLSLEIVGIGNFDQIIVPKLNLPDFCTYYESKTRTEREERVSYLAGKKIFEYIVQVGKSGRHQIEPQLFTYFDTENKTYKTLRSNPVTLNIKNPPVQQGLSYDNYSNIKENSSLDPTSYNEDINFIEEDVPFITKQSREALPVIWIVVLMVSSFLIYFKKFFMNLFKRLFSGFFIKNVSAKLEKDLDLIISEEKAESLYKFFINYFSSRFNLEQDEINESLIENKLIDFGLDKEKVDMFLSYLHLCASLSFAAASDDYLDKSKLLDKSKYWFFMLESKNNR